MRFSSQEKDRKSGRASRLLALALLFVFAHAFVVSATHFHRAGGASADAQTSFTQRASLDTQTRAETDAASGHAQCLLCRLQRSLTADLDRQSFVPAPPSRKLSDIKAVSTVAPLSNAYLAPAGRAPPVA
ncbi:MAG TPA: hypothetical protein VGB73_00400 [Pyrinomonadaceae bacterium]